MLIKSRLVSNIKHIDKSINEQLWLELDLLPDVVIGGVYIPPSESSFFLDTAFPDVQRKTLEHKSFIFGGDMNARCGSLTNNLISNTDSSSVTYTTCDPVMNSNGRDVIQICKDNHLYIVNGLSIDGAAPFPCELTFRRKKKWISDLDKCIVSKDLSSCINSFFINQDTKFPSDHAPIEISMIFPDNIPRTLDLLESAMNMGAHSITYSKVSPCKKGIPLSSVDATHFTRSVQLCENPILQILELGNPESAATAISEAMYQCLEQSRKPDFSPNSENPAESDILPRWKRIMDMKNEKALWSAVDWNGDISPVSEDNSDKRPSDEQFRSHIEALLNPTDVDCTYENILVGYITILFLFSTPQSK